ncbi:MLV-related proviral Env polyprotein-like, partial [Mesocricetus auratus]|uniref:MLV-related proviral Env polyprotein-like n=1 Tax=Mesocricetus auratus TaxID=10036 RepID=A0ABM2WPB8_MESAU
MWGVINATFPPLHVDLRDLVGKRWDHSEQALFPGYGCQHTGQRISTRKLDIHVCPGHNRDKELQHRCGGSGDGYCAEWGCETTGTTYWKPTSSWDLITLQRGTIPGYNGDGPWTCGGQDCGPCHDSSSKLQGSTPGGRCNPLITTFTEAAKRSAWDAPKAWGLRLYHTGMDPAATFLISRTISPTAMASIGPNSVLLDQPDRPSQNLPRPKPNPLPSVTTLPTHATGHSNATLPPRPKFSSASRLLNLIRGAHQALNETHPDKVEDCWLCLTAAPPYYEGLALDSDLISYTSPPSRCSETLNHKLTLPQVTGRGLCLGNVPRSSQKLCNHTVSVPPSNSYLTSPNGTYWACNTGLTPCVSVLVLNITADYCVLVQLWPHITYHSSETVLGYFENRYRFRREPVSITLALLLGVGGIAAGIGTGTTALLRSNQNTQLQAAMNEDLQALEKSVRALKDSLVSLSELVLQNRRGLDLLFLRQGGLCAALKEECCFYADKTGVVTETLDKLKERLTVRRKNSESQQY